MAVEVAVLVEATGAAKSARGTATCLPESGARRTVLGRHSGSGQRMAQAHKPDAMTNTKITSEFTELKARNCSAHCAL